MLKRRRLNGRRLRKRRLGRKKMNVLETESQVEEG